MSYQELKVGPLKKNMREIISMIVLKPEKVKMILESGYLTGSKGLESINVPSFNF